VPQVTKGSPDKSLTQQYFRQRVACVLFWSRSLIEQAQGFGYGLTVLEAFVFAVRPGIV
jgi:hypothetical protein